MTETETEAETIERLENALRRIGEVARRPRTPEGASGGEPELDREALLHSLDLLIGNLRNGLESLTPKPEQK